MSELQARIEHPAPASGQVAPVWLFAGLAGAPAAWVMQMLVDYGLASNACTLTQGRHGQQASAGFAGETWVLMAVNLAFFAVAVGAGLLSRSHWNTTRGETAGGVHAQLSIGEGRTRFVALAGMMTAFTFALAILFDTVEPLIVPLCWSLR